MLNIKYKYCRIILMKLVFLLSFMSPIVSANQADDDYLQSLEVEVEKVGDTALADEGVSSSNAKVGEGFQGSLSFDEFPLELKRKSPGSYTFYGKLTGNDREEIYLSYKEGASVKEVRAAIMARFLKK